MRLVACALALGSLASCEDGHPAVTPVDSAWVYPDVAQPTFPLEIPMTIVVGHQGLSVYMNGVDKLGCGCAPAEFLGIGERGVSADGFICADRSTCPGGSCITELGVEVDGVRLTQQPIDWVDPWDLPFDTFPMGATTLVIAGCGHPQTRIPIDRLALPAVIPTVTMTADYDVVGHPRVSWTTSVPVMSASVGIAWPGPGGFGAHVPGSETQYTVTEVWGAFFASVTVFLSRTEITTGFGPATVWHAGPSAGARFPPKPAP